VVQRLPCTCLRSVSPGGDLRTEFTIDDQPSGLGWMPDGSMLIVSMKKRQVLRRAKSGAISIHADLNPIATFHGNDMVVGPSGDAYVGNFGFDIEHEMTTRGREQVIANHVTAKLAYVAPNGEVSVAADEMHFPNGSVITPDGKTLIVGETLAGVLTAFDLGPGGALSNRRV
jgi:sugar lactone lactonase YvrE